MALWKKKRQNSTAFLLVIHHKQIDCIMKFDILREAEYNKLSTLQVSRLQIGSVLSRQRKNCSFNRSVSKNFTMTKVDVGTPMAKIMMLPIH